MVTLAGPEPATSPAPVNKNALGGWGGGWRGAGWGLGGVGLGLAAGALVGAALTAPWWGGYYVRLTAMAGVIRATPMAGGASRPFVGRRAFGLAFA